LKSLTPEITIIAVSHRPRLIEIADEVVQLKDGAMTRVTAESCKADGVSSVDSRRDLLKAVETVQ
jgi:ABC-type protease/lipase transport system fused ATPase/permease subunit